MRGVRLLGALFASLASSKAIDPREGPTVVLYVDTWAMWGRDFQPADLDRTVLQRAMPYKQLQLLHSFLTPTPTDCQLRCTDAWGEFGAAGDSPTSPHASNYEIKSWGEEGGNIQGWLGYWPVFKKRYPAVQFLPSVGGWSLSWAFTECVKDAKKAQFTKGIVNVIKAFNFDGVDIDWEYPACTGPCGCQNEPTCPLTSNETDPEDWDRYIAFLKELRTTLDTLAGTMGKERMLITGAIGMNLNLLRGNGGPYGAPTPLKELCEVMDNVNMMTYDFFGTWLRKTGPLAPLMDTAGVPDDDDTNIDKAIQLAISMCEKPEKLIMGLATYGKGWKEVPKTGTPPGLWQESAATTAQDWMASSKIDEGGEPKGGSIPWWEVWSEATTNPKCTPTFDDASLTATLFCDQNLHGENNVFISYEDRISWQKKMSYAKKNGLGGAIIWAAGDLGNGRRDNGVDTAHELWNGLFQGWFGDDKLSVGKPAQFTDWKYQGWRFPGEISEKEGACPAVMYNHRNRSGNYPPKKEESGCDENAVYQPPTVPDGTGSQPGNGGVGGGDVGEDGDTPPFTGGGQGGGNEPGPTDAPGGGGNPTVKPTVPPGGTAPGGGTVPGGGSGVAPTFVAGLVSLILIYVSC